MEEELRGQCMGQTRREVVHPSSVVSTCCNYHSAILPVPLLSGVSVERGIEKGIKQEDL